MITLPKTWSEFCKITKRDPKKLPDVSMYDKKHQKHAIADFKLTLIIEYCNEGWIPDYTNYNEYKYFPYFEVKADKKHLSGFSVSHLR